MIALAIIVIMIALAIAAPLFVSITHHGANSPSPTPVRTRWETRSGPGPTASGSVPMTPGRDLFIRILYGARISLFVGVVTTFVAAAFGVALGLMAGYFGGLIDMALARFTDSVLAFPYVVLAIALAAVFGPSLTIIIGDDHVLLLGGHRAYRARPDPVDQGAGVHRGGSIDRLRAVADHVPRHPAEPARPGARARHAVSSRPPSCSSPPCRSSGWASAARRELGQHPLGGAELLLAAWWYLVFPALALLITTLAFNLLGDGIRDAMDPRTERLIAAGAQRGMKSQATGGG